ncbi:MAG: beta-N-acetylglucosaminidase domain-containing protein [bacterium]
MRRWLPVVVWMAIGTSARAEPLDLAPWARVTASGTRNTTFGLWPRESDDAPATVRDGDPATSWKVPRDGATLSLDFFPVVGQVPTLARVRATWSVAPTRPPRLRLLDGCGGALVRELSWDRPGEELRIEPAAVASCVTLTVPGDGAPALAELGVFAAPVALPPRIADLRADLASVAPGGVRLLWSVAGDGASPHHVDVHYLTSAAEPLTTANRVTRSHAGLVREITLPARAAIAAAVPIAEDGSAGSPIFAELPGRAPVTLAASGAVEGFYGRPWSHDERREMIVRLATSGLGRYVYAPKNDPLHRADWRTPYGDEALARFTEIRALGERVGVVVSMGISPGLDIVIADPADRAALVAKLLPFVARGFRDFTLLLDDIEDSLTRPIDAALGAEHRDLANGLLASLEAAAGERVSLALVPTVYSTERQRRFAGGDGYLDALRSLDPSIEVMWTGTDTLSPTLSAADLADVTRRLGRAVVIWDNEHANDGGDLFFGKIWLAPFGNRSSDLRGATRGLLANPMIQGSLDRLVLPTYAGFLARGEDPYYARRRAVEMELGTGSYSEVLGRLMDMFLGHGAQHPEGVATPIDAPMEAAIQGFRDALPFGGRKAVALAGGKLARVAAEMATVHEALAWSDLAPDLVDDLWYPTERFVHEGRALLEILDFARASLAGWPADAESLAAAKEQLHRALLDRFQTSPLVVQYLEWTLEQDPPRARNVTAPAIGRPPARAKVGEVVEWWVTPGAARVDVYGIPFLYTGSIGAEASLSSDARAGGTRLGGAPFAPGHYRGVVVVSDDHGWNWRDVHIVVTR